MNPRARSWLHPPLAAVLTLAACTVAPTTPEDLGKAPSSRSRKATRTASASATAPPRPTASPATPTPSPAPTGTPTPAASASGGSLVLATPTPTPAASATATIEPVAGATPAPTPVPSNLPSPGAATVGTFAGTGSVGMVDGPATSSATFKEPRGLALGPDGEVYVADTGNHIIRKIQGGQVTRVLGDGTFTTPNDAARLRSPEGIAVGRDGVIYISDTGNHRIRKHTPGTVGPEGLPVTDWVIGNGGQGFTDGDPATGADTAQVNGPSGIALTEDQAKLWVVDSGNHTIRLITLANRTVVTVAGKGGAAGDVDGAGETARFDTPKGCHAVGNDTLYVADSGNSKIRKVVLSGAVGTVTTEPFPNLFQPAGVLGFGGFLFVSDEGRRTVERTPLGSDTVEVLAMSEQPGFLDGDALTEAQFLSLADLLVLPSGEVLVADPGNHRIRTITPR
ncbi:MAG: hypothetical protein VKQ33_02350 [Candidatus Sericytochromatia bacterium]|nr:hypothetical protein [Candidatus Sericytochromatia bacterium]